MPTFRYTIDIDATPDQVWGVLGDLASADRWIPGVTTVTVDGMTRLHLRGRARTGRANPPLLASEPLLRVRDRGRAAPRHRQRRPIQCPGCQRPCTGGVGLELRTAHPDDGLTAGRDVGAIPPHDPRQPQETGRGGCKQTRVGQEPCNVTRVSPTEKRS